ncbi:MAG: hypothetical protein MUP49_00985 [Dehalococcoidia bacterium]|jgi:hypothetical protein|nr:hypothetical protein [Dehalococcoidia bacterium]
MVDSGLVLGTLVIYGALIVWVFYKIEKLQRRIETIEDYWLPIIKNIKEQLEQK